MINVDYKCMEYAQKINAIKESKNLENNLRKALGVLQEDGIYAMFLWIEDKEKRIRDTLIEMLNENGIKGYFLENSKSFSKEFNPFCKDLKEVSKDIDKLLFMKKLLERTLTYALYHAKIG